MERFKFLPKNKLDNLPKTSGVYCFAQKNARCPTPIIYIGKAGNIRSRVFPYYTSAKHPKTKCTYCHLEMKQASKQQVMAHTHVIENSKSEIRNSKFMGRIECYDISNIQGKQATGSMVVFVNGKPDKSQYRKFSIRIAQPSSSARGIRKRPSELLEERPNDVGMLKQILQRRFRHPEWQFPDVILIDGGKAQLNAAIKVREQFHRIVPLVISIAKGKQELFIEDRNPPASGPIPLKQLPQEVYNLVKQLDDEAHRFALSYHKKLRKKHLFQ